MLKLSALLIAATLPLLAKPNFTGTWKMNASKSEFGQFPAPSSMTQKVAHEDPSLKVSTSMASDMGEFNFDATYSTDGKETTNEFGPSSMKSTAKWDGETLVIESKGSFGDTEMTMSDKWSLSSDGKALTMQRHWKSSRGEMDQKVVFDKQ